ncbi:putative phospho protein phosphatase [Kockovaella imperatae]|uniref:Serine/threonine-protein phosphatase n=1 Tax=Kockovaella imperatae TaxID=4999 RepID=A0A1Y1U9W8_9TREE|nr:putative phospho protein phosphatase [Kockovaella imperatae]ORX34306.1 putative phospho protein phosphatase [Kockovaella imperatae]
MSDSSGSLSSPSPGVESPLASSSSSWAPEDDITPFPSPVLSAQHLAGLSLGMDGELEPEVDMEKIVTDKDREMALEIKGRANKAFAGKDFTLSIDLYTEAIALNPKDATFWNNRAMSKAKMEEHGAAIADASRAIDLNPSYAKAYYRRGVSQLAILRPSDAVPDFKKALELDPSNRAIREQLQATIKLMRRIEFEKAISTGEAESITAKCLSLIASGSCILDTSSKSADMPLPTIPSDPNGRYEPTEAFVTGMIESFKSGGKIPKRVAWEIILGVYDLVVKEKSLVYVTIPKGATCDVVGDTHGQFYDVYNLLSLIRPPSDTHYIVFNGDFVDRGSWSIEVVLTLFAYKWLLPDRVFLNRGNHETSDMNKVYGFEGEAKNKLGEMTYKLFAEVFTSLPLATLVTASQTPTSTTGPNVPSPLILSNGLKRYFIVHGGPPCSKDGVSLDEIEKIQRLGQQPGQSGLMCEMLWTDPQPQPGRGPSKRGVGLGFGPDITRKWCEDTSVTAVIRSHEVRQNGVACEHNGLCWTVFSCPNYCDSTGNQGGWITISDSGDLTPHTFDAVPHPDVKPMAYSNMFGMMGM